MSRSLFPYASRYCEENVWQLLRSEHFPSGPRAALFISNASRSCAVWRQSGAPSPEEPVVWDYHVVAVELGPAPRIWDLDSTLAFPSPALDYLAASFPLAGALPAEYEPHFRLVAHGDFVARFASDRSHMRAPDGRWLAPPPPWPAIATERGQMTLMRFVDLGSGEVGEVLDLPQLRARLRGQ